MSRTIQAILPPKRPNARTVVVFDDGTSLKLLPQIAAENGLCPGLELEESERKALEAANAAASAKQRAVRIISAAAVSKGDLAQRLTQKGETPADAQNAVRWLEELNLLDDAETARQIVSRGVSRGYGVERIKQMLYAKRIPKQYWDEALAGVPDMSDALEAFSDGIVVIFADDRRLQRLDESIDITDIHNLTFIKLTMLAGRMW